MYEQKPKRSSPTARIAVTLLLLASIAAFGGSAFTPTPVVLQCVGLCLLLPMIQIVGRHFLLQYLYRVRTLEDGNVDFEVFTYRGGDRMQLVCRIGLEEITAATPLSAENKKPPHGKRRYNYHPDLAPKSGLVLSISNGDGECEILLSPDERLTALLTPRK